VSHVDLGGPDVANRELPESQLYRLRILGQWFDCIRS